MMIAILVKVLLITVACNNAFKTVYGKQQFISNNLKIYNHNNNRNNNNIFNKNINTRNVMSLRGGFQADLSIDLLKTHLTSNPSNLFNGLLILLLSGTAIIKGIEKFGSSSTTATDEKPAGVKDLQIRFLTVFWLLRMADWLQGPYFYEVYSSKIINGLQVTPDLVSKLFLVGFASTGILGPWIGSFVDNFGRKAGTLVFVLLYALGALSTASSNLWILLAGRFASGVGTSLLHSAPEAWLVGDYMKKGFSGSWLGQTFGYAYAGDSLVAITAGQLAAATAATSLGATGPFLLSLGFLAVGGLLALVRWKENTAPRGEATNGKVSVSDALSVILTDKKILLVGAVQALFEGAMYIFVLQWPPAIKAALLSSNWLGSGSVPYGTIFSCFMASCLFGSSIFSKIQSKVKSQIELPTSLMLTTAAVAMSTATFFGLNNLAVLAGAFFVFEACVGMYFPSIGTLRSKYIPDSHRSVIMNLFGVPLNLIVVSVFLSIKSLGVSGALTVASGALAIAAACMTALTLSGQSIKSEQKDIVTGA